MTNGVQAEVMWAAVGWAASVLACVHKVHGCSKHCHAGPVANASTSKLVIQQLNAMHDTSFWL